MADTPRLAPYDLSRVGLFPLPNVVLFPSQLLSLHVFEPRYRKLVSDVIAQGLVLAVPRLAPGYDASYYGAPPVLETCGIGQITEYSRLPDGRFNIVVLGLGRGRILDELRSEPYRVARFAALVDEQPSSPMVLETLRTELYKLVRRVSPQLAGPAKELETRMRSAADASECADIAAGTLIEDPDERQALLEELDPSRRLTTLIAHVHELGLRLTGPESGATQRRLN
jgi:Lon protease-like protein